jgi:hypothetical protein
MGKGIDTALDHLVAVLGFYGCFRVISFCPLCCRLHGGGEYYCKLHKLFHCYILLLCAGPLLYFCFPVILPVLSELMSFRTQADVRVLSISPFQAEFPFSHSLLHSIACAAYLSPDMMMFLRLSGEILKK